MIKKSKSADMDESASTWAMMNLGWQKFLFLSVKIFSKQRSQIQKKNKILPIVKKAPVESML